MPIVNAFTCTGAYAVLIMSGLKRVENRSCMPVPARGRCAMSVSKKFCRKEYESLLVWLAEHGDPSVFAQLLKWDEVKSWPGCLVGTMDYDAMDRVPGNTALARECRIWNEGYPNWWLLLEHSQVACSHPLSRQCRDVAAAGRASVTRSWGAVGIAMSSDGKMWTRMSHENAVGNANRKIANDHDVTLFRLRQASIEQPKRFLNRFFG